MDLIEENSMIKQFAWRARLLIKESTLPSGTYPTLSRSARVPRMGECADKLYAWPLFIRDKSRMR